MNKQEAIDQLKESLSKMIENIEDENDFNKGYRYATQHYFDIINQLDESEKPVVPKFVADWYEERKDYFDFNIYGFYKYFYSQGKHEEVKKWLDNAENKAIETLVKMKLYGYEVEKEKLYEVFLKRTGAQLGVCVPHGEDKTQFTKVELQEYGFDNLDEYEITEVEE
ncbi:DUF1642 domain-containing protein [uncultured Streptococcus sp.]|uniref:DUF1642 domain-containing protein n=1 Tax=uncultured Streptococcus sp. TaxID=83427 RepID=UPI002596EA6A|nr:DUF1642 domain-containing protein [uncultured Streptococcus sp.]